MWAALRTGVRTACEVSVCGEGRAGRWTDANRTATDILGVEMKGERNLGQLAKYLLSKKA